MAGIRGFLPRYRPPAPFLPFTVAGRFDDEGAPHRLAVDTSGQHPIETTHAAIARVYDHSDVIAVDLDFDWPPLDEADQGAAGVPQLESANQIGFHLEPPLAWEAGRESAGLKDKNDETDD
jgi:hypothetical protein